MCKNRIFSPPIIFPLAVFFCLIAVRVEQAAQQGPQPDKSADKESKSQQSGPQSPGDLGPARWPIFLPRKSQPSGPQSSGGGAQEQKQEQKQESKTTPTPPAPEKQSAATVATSNEPSRRPGSAIHRKNRSGLAACHGDRRL